MEVAGKAFGYYLFLEPSGALKDELEATIGEFAKEYGGPVFFPHVTLLGHIPDMPEAEARGKAAAIAAATPPLELTFGDIGMEDYYFRAFYLRVEPGDALMQLRARALEAFGSADDRPYAPHLSLLYGDYEASRKMETAKRMGEYRGRSFAAHSLTLSHAQGEPKDWRRIGTFPFAAAV